MNCSLNIFEMSKNSLKIFEYELHSWETEWETFGRSFKALSAPRAHTRNITINENSYLDI